MFSVEYVRDNSTKQEAFSIQLSNPQQSTNNELSIKHSSTMLLINVSAVSVLKQSEGFMFVFQ